MPRVRVSVVDVVYVLEQPFCAVRIFMINFKFSMFFRFARRCRMAFLCSFMSFNGRAWCGYGMNLPPLYVMSSFLPRWNLASLCDKIQISLKFLLYFRSMYTERACYMAWAERKVFRFVKCLTQLPKMAKNFRKRMLECLGLCRYETI